MPDTTSTITETDYEKLINFPRQLFVKERRLTGLERRARSPHPDKDCRVESLVPAISTGKNMLAGLRLLG